MKFNFLFILSLLFLFACGKDDDINPGDSSDIPEGTFSAKIDGELMDSPSSAKALLSEIDTSILNITMFQLNGADVYTSGLFKSMIVIFSATELNLIEDTYTSNDECNAITLCPILIYHQQGSSVDDPDTYATASNAVGGDFSITFSELDFRVGGNAKGTFSGRLYDEEHQTYRDLTEGKFNLPIQ